MQEQNAKEKEEKREKESAHKAASLGATAWSYAAACIQQQRRHWKHGDTQTHHSSEAACLKVFEV